MSQPINHHRNKSGPSHADTSVAQLAISTIEKHLAGAKRVDLRKAGEALAQLVAPISHREYEHAEAERKRLRAKHYSRDAVERAARAFLKAIANGDS